MTPLHGYTIVFDLDGTLVDTAPDLIRATEHALGSKGIKVSEPSKLRQSISFGARQMIVDALADAHHAVSDAEIDGLHGTFIEYYVANIAHSSRPYRDAMTTLQNLRSAGARLAVCTNKREMLARALLEALRMDHFFEAIAGLETFPVSKPHPGHILGTIQLAGGDPARAIMVGDSENDVKAARAAGVPVIGFVHGYTDIPIRDLCPDSVFEEYLELERVIDALLARPAV